jgi:exodeoxyribonuclease-3
MKVASWNVNSVTARKDRLLAWLGKAQPDVLCIQELKAVDEGFPRAEVEALGYHVALHGQRTYNGVAILAKQPIEHVTRGLSDGVAEADSRLIAATIEGVRVVCCYVPNGQTLTSDKYPYKLSWLDRLKKYVAKLDGPHLVCGDFNVAPEDRDVYDPEGLRDDVLVHEYVRERFQALLSTGLVDTYRLHTQDAGKYSWWDYRQLGFPKNRGLRIDFVLASKELAARCTGAVIDREERKGKLPSDHAPVWAEFS